MRNDVSRPRSVIRAYFGFQIFFSMLVWLPIFYEFQKRIGLDDRQIFSIQSIYYIVFCLLEIPTGVLADRWGTKNCLIAGSLSLVASNMFPIFAQSYEGFLAHFILIALSRSLISGASSAYLYDYLSSRQASGIFKEIEGKARAFGLLAKVVCWTFVGWLMEMHLTLPYWVTAGSALLSLGFVLFLPQEVRKSPLAASPTLGSVFDFLGVIRGTPFLLFLVLQGVAIFTLGRIAQVNLFQPILTGKAMPVSLFGIVMAAMTIFEALGSAYPSLIKRYMTDLWAIFVLTLAMAACLAVIPLCGEWLTVVSLCIFSLAAGFAYPIQRQLMNDSIPDSRYRATLLSFESIVDRAFCAWTASIMGASVGTLAGLNEFLVISSLATLICVGVLALCLCFKGRLVRASWRTV